MFQLIISCRPIGMSVHGHGSICRVRNPVVFRSPKPQKDTIYLCVVDVDGSLSLINSMFEPFGSGILAPDSGVILNNRGYSFNLEAGHPNCIAPRKLPMNTIVPGMLMREGQMVAPFGAMGR